MRAVTYIHQNPQKHGFVNDFRTWPFTSYHTLISEAATRLRREELFNWFGGKTNFLSWHDVLLNEDQVKDTVKNIIKEINNRIPYELYELFANEPDKYIKISDSISRIVDANKINSEIIIFKEFFRNKIKKSFEKTGFKLIYQEELTSEEIITINQYHRNFPDMNYFNNILGSLIIGRNNLNNLPEDMVIEKSTFFIVVGKKI